MVADVQRSKNTLDVIQRSISRVNNPEFDNTISETQLNLYNLSNSETDIIVDKNVKDKFKKVYDRLWPAATPLTVGQEIANRIGDIDNEITSIGITITAIDAELTGTPTPNATRTTQLNTQKTNHLTRRTALTNEKYSLSAQEVERNTRHDEYRELYETANSFNYTPTPLIVSPVGGVTPTVDFRATPPRTALNNVIVNVDPIFRNAPVVPTRTDISYILCDGSGNKLEKNSSGKYIYKYNGTEILLSGIDETTVHGQFNFRDLVTEPVLETKELKLSLKAFRKTPDGTYTMTTEKKDFKLDLVGTSLSATDRGQVLEHVNTQPWTVLQTKLTDTYDTYREDYEKEMLLKVCKKAFLDASGSEAKWKKLFPTPEHENELYTRLRREYTTPPLQAFATTLATAAHFTTFDTGFKPRYADDKREWNKKPENIKDASAYKNYLMSTYPTEIQNYMKEKFEKVFTDKPAHDFITAKFLQFKDEQEKRGEDNNSHVHLDTSLPSEPNKHRDNHLLGMIPFGKARSYVSLFTGAGTSVKNQRFSLRGTDNKPEEILYDMDVKVHSANKIALKIVKKDPTTGKEIAVMEPSAGDPVSLIHKVLRSLTRLKGKERMHIAYSVMRSMIEIAKSKKIPLSYTDTDPATGHPQTRTLSVGNDENIIVESDTVDTLHHRSDVKKVFDYNEHFAATQNRDCGAPGKPSLEEWILEAMNHFNRAMECSYQNYRDVISNKIFWTPDKLDTKINTRRYQPFKWMNNLRNKRNFAYDIPSTRVGDAQVQISFKENNDFEITLQRYGQTYMFKGSNLKKILKAKRGGKKVFEGIGNEVLALVHNKHFESLRENTKMVQEDQLFAAKDPKTERRYFMDNEGRLSYVDHYDATSITAFNNEVRTAANRKRGRNIAGAVGATAGAGALGVGAGLGIAGGSKVAGAAQAAGAGVLGGTATHKWFTKIFHKNEENYGVIHNTDNLDIGRTYCSPQEQERLLHSNPVLMGRLRKAMKNRMGFFESGRAALAKMRA